MLNGNEPDVNLMLKETLLVDLETEKGKKYILSAK